MIGVRLDGDMGCTDTLKGMFPRAHFVYIYIRTTHEALALGGKATFITNEPIGRG